ncbi:unnamed protein product [Prunus armeniaca]
MGGKAVRTRRPLDANTSKLLEFPSMVFTSRSHLKLNQFTFMGSHLYFEDLINTILSPTECETNIQNDISF